MRFLRAATAIVLVAAVPTCGGSEEQPGAPIPSPKVISTQDFASDCTDPDALDCVAVSEGDTCTACLCPNATIAKKDKDAYEKRYAELKAQCPNTEPCSRVCLDPKLVCAAGKCKLKSSISDAAAPSD